MSWFVAMLFGCTHRHCSFPITTQKPGTVSTTYVVCLDCGKEFPYDWEQMKLVALAAAKNKRRAAA
jgi:hypothetical protein